MTNSSLGSNSEFRAPTACAHRQGYQILFSWWFLLVTQLDTAANAASADNAVTTAITHRQCCSRTTTLAFVSALSSHQRRRHRCRHPVRTCSQRDITFLALQEADDDGIGVGIDLGTTNSAIAYLKDGITPTIISIPHNGRTMPSVVTFMDTDHKDGNSAIVGRLAEQYEAQVGGAYRNVKRILGTGGKISMDVVTVVPFVQASTVGKTFKKDSLLNQIHDGTENPTLLTDLRDPNKVIRPELISSHILLTLKQAAEEQLGQRISRAVIGVPAYFHDSQREATKRAAEMAGIPKVKLLREPEAAALAYGLGKEQLGLQTKRIDNTDDDELVLVFDLGGGTFDVSILLVGGGVTEIVSTSGNAQLGGSVFDSRIAAYCVKLIQQQLGSTKRWSRTAQTAVILAAEAIRIYLSNNRWANLVLPLAEKEWSAMTTPSSVILDSTEDNSNLLEQTELSNSTHIHVQLTRRDMERLCKEEFQALLRPIREVAIMAGALLPGDSSPSIVAAALELEQDEGTDLYSKLEFDDFYTEEVVSDDINSDMLIALKSTEMKEAKKSQQQGRKRARDVAKQERKYRQEKKKLDESTLAQSGGDRVKIRDGISGRPISRVVLVGGATRMPGIGRLLAAVTGVVPQKTVNPDEAVALGCAVHAGVLDGVSGMGTVLNPMQAAILRAVAQSQSFDDGDFDEGDYESIVID